MKKKVGFLGKFKASNVNLADPIATNKWRNLIAETLKLKTNWTELYEGNNYLPQLMEISSKEDQPDKLLSYGRNLDEFINTAKKENIRKDSDLLKVVKLYSETTIASNDKYAIDLATAIMKKIIKNRSA